MRLLQLLCLLRSWNGAGLVASNGQGGLANDCDGVNAGDRWSAGERRSVGDLGEAMRSAASASSLDRKATKNDACALLRGLLESTGGNYHAKYLQSVCWIIRRRGSVVRRDRL